MEDEAPKLRHISEYLRSVVAGLRLDTATSVTSAISKLEAGQYDVVILDMSLPTFDLGENESGGRPQGFGGTELMRNMLMADIRVPAIVVTGYEVFPKGGGGQLNFDQLRKDLAEEFGGRLVGVLHYSSAVEEWKGELMSLMARL